MSLGFLALQGCGEQKADVKAVKQVADERVVPNSKLSLEIEGMVCEKGCGASIRKALKSTGGVASCTFDFEEERQKNTAVVEFDKDKITADKIIAVVTSINEKQFTVTGSSAERMEVTVQESDNGQPVSEATKVNVSEATGFEMPNLLKLFSGMLSGN